MPKMNEILVNLEQHEVEQWMTGI